MTRRRGMATLPPPPRGPYLSLLHAIWFPSPTPAQRAKDNSPALQCWVRVRGIPSPGRDDRNVAPIALSSLTGLTGFRTVHPALKCWAIFSRPCGPVPPRTDRCRELRCALPASVDGLSCGGGAGVWRANGLGKGYGRAQRVPTGGGGGACFGLVSGRGLIAHFGHAPIAN